MSLENFKQALRTKNYKQIKQFCKMQPSLINQQDVVGNTPLHDVVKISEKYSKDKDYTQTLDYQKIAHYLIKHGGDLQIKNNKGEIILDRKQTQNSKPILLDDYEMVGGKKKKH